MEPKVEPKYKDTVFRMLFKDKKNLLELYNAINGTAYNDENDLEVITLENAVYLNVKNDVACILDMRMQLYEHQSTVNPNMPFRDLIYVAKELESYLHKQKKDIYSKRLVMIPTPRFVVFYNGVEDQPERMELKLSDAFAVKEDKVNLELRVEVLNINLGHNQEILDTCDTLQEYCIYVDRVRTYVENLPIEEAVDRAVNECIEENVLCEFLTNQKAEAKAMSIFEYDEERVRKLAAKENYEDGLEQGKKQGLEQGRLNMICTFLKNGGKEVDAINLLNVTEEELKQAKELLEN